jgi:hypothetical protein
MFLMSICHRSSRELPGGNLAPLVMTKTSWLHPTLDTCVLDGNNSVLTIIRSE